MNNDINQNQKQAIVFYLQFLSKLQALNLKHKKVITDYVKGLEQRKILDLEKKISAN